MNRRPKLIALAAGFASATGFAPLGFWPVTLMCLAVLMMLVAGAPNWRGAFARSWFWGVGHFTLGLNWIAHAFDFQDAMPHALGYLAVVLLSLYLAVYPGVAGLVAYLASPRRRPGPLATTSAPETRAAPASAGATYVLAFAAAWIVTEYARATFFTGFAWDPLGAIWVGSGIARIAIAVGTYGLSGVSILIAGLLAQWMVRTAATAWQDARAYPGWLRPMFSDGTWVTGLIVPIFYLMFLLLPMLWLFNIDIFLTVQPAVRDSAAAIRIVQHNLSQADRHDAAHDEDSVQRLERLTGPPTREPRLILWPEGAVPYFLEEEGFARDRLAKLLGPRDLLLTGGDALIYDKQHKLVAARNSLFALTPNARLIARYDKAHLVPYGEYLPMRPLLTAIGLSRLVPGDLDFIAGPGPGTMTLPGFGNAGVQICYEITFSGEVVDHAHRPDFIFNPSTDAWFGSWGPPQHLAQARLRAIEEGLPVLRATPTGISAVVDADGRLLAALPLNKAGFIAERLPPPHPPTLFARYGNAIPLTLALLLALLAVAPRFLGR